MKKLFAFLMLLGCLQSLSAQQDTAPPTIICKQNVVNFPMSPSGTTTIFATQNLYDTLYDNVSTDIKLGIRKACIGAGFPQSGLKANYNYPGRYGVEVWARDEAGNTSSCVTHIAINLPGNNDRQQLNVILGNEANDGIEEAEIELRGNLCQYDTFVYRNTEDFGECCIWAPEPGSSFVLKAKKDDNPLNGVTTYDMVLIANHIMGIAPLNSPYKMIAADANYDGKITTLDIIIFRKLILGIIQELPQGESWRFVPGDYVFPNPQNPFVPGFPEAYVVPFTAEPPRLDYKFIGVKIGDVNNTAVSNN